jgi:hypothetical protein
MIMPCTADRKLNSKKQDGCSTKRHMNMGHLVRAARLHRTTNRGWQLVVRLRPLQGSSAGPGGGWMSHNRRLVRQGVHGIPHHAQPLGGAIALKALHGTAECTARASAGNNVGSVRHSQMHPGKPVHQRLCQADMQFTYTNTQFPDACVRSRRGGHAAADTICQAPRL